MIPIATLRRSATGGPPAHDHASEYSKARAHRSYRFVRGLVRRSRGVPGSGRHRPNQPGSEARACRLPRDGCERMVRHRSLVFRFAGDRAHSIVGHHVGLFRHYWVVSKLVIVVLATALLLMHMQPADRVAGVAAVRRLSSADLHAFRVQLAIDSGAAILALLTASTLSVYKPGGLTAYGLRTDCVRSKRKIWGLQRFDHKRVALVVFLWNHRRCADRHTSSYRRRPSWEAPHSVITVTQPQDPGSGLPSVDPPRGHVRHRLPMRRSIRVYDACGVRRPRHCATTCGARTNHDAPVACLTA